MKSLYANKRHCRIDLNILEMTDVWKCLLLVKLGAKVVILQTSQWYLKNCFKQYTFVLMKMSREYEPQENLSLGVPTR